jgi:glutaredoxin-related protein
MTTTQSTEDQINGGSYTTDKVHVAVRVSTGQLKPACGMSNRRVAFLYETEEEVNCTKCLANH